MKSTLLALAAASAVFAAAPAAAEDMRVEYADLNLATEDGQKALDRRIDSAARKFCAVGATATGTRIRSGEAQRCYSQAKAEAKKQLAAIVAEQRLGG